MANLLVPGLNAPLRDEDYEKSWQLYENLLDDDSLDGTQQIFDDHLPRIFEIMDRHEVLGLFCIHSAHKHYPLAAGTVRCGTSDGPPVYRRTKPTRVKDLCGKKIHGDIFAVTASGLQAYEFQDGDLPNFSHLSYDGLCRFLNEFIDYVREKGLEHYFGLQIRDEIDQPVTWECFDGQESSMIEESEAEKRGYKPGRTTGWVGTRLDGGGVRIRGQTIHEIGRAHV